MNYVVLELNLEEKDIISCVEELLPVECQTRGGVKEAYGQYAVLF